MRSRQPPSQFRIGKHKRFALQASSIAILLLMAVTLLSACESTPQIEPTSPAISPSPAMPKAAPPDVTFTLALELVPSVEPTPPVASVQLKTDIEPTAMPHQSLSSGEGDAEAPAQMGRLKWRFLGGVVKVRVR